MDQFEKRLKLPERPSLDKIREAILNNPAVKRGMHGEIKMVTPEIAAKIYNNKKFLYDCRYWSNHEFELGKELLAKGISVPRMHELLAPKTMKGINKWVVLMEYIHDTNIDSMPEQERKRISGKIEEEFNKVELLGYEIPDFEKYDNVLYDAGKDQVYLIDFINWWKPKTE